MHGFLYLHDLSLLNSLHMFLILVFTQVLHMEMSNMLENSSLLYNFQKFMKREGALNILQFCLTVGKL